MNIFLMRSSQRKDSCKNFATFTISVFLFSLIFLNPYKLPAQSNGQNYALLIGGLGGQQQYSEKIFQYLEKTRSSLINRFQFPEQNIILLAETKYQENPIVNGISKEETIRSQFTKLSELVNENDNIFIILYGHGNYDGKNSRLNIPGRDLRDVDYNELLDQLNAKQAIFINTASSGYPFIQTLAVANRIVITATSSPTQRNFTIFPEFFVEGLANEEVDFDRNKNVSVFELFKYSAEKTDRFFADNNHLATEFAMLEDTGDRLAFRISELAENNEGNLAAVTYLKSGSGLFTFNESEQEDSSVVWRAKEKEKIELEIAKLKSKKNQINEKDYFARLEKLLLDLAKLNEKIDKKNK